MPLDVITLGDAAVDLIAYVPRHPQSGGDTEVSSMERHSGGSAANFAIAIQRLAMTCALIGKVGSDEAGDFVRSELKREGVDVSHLTEELGGTGAVVVLVEKTGQRTMLSFRGVNVKLAPEDIPREYIARSRWLHVSGYSLTHRPQSEAALTAMEYASEAGITVSLDPSPHIHLAPKNVVADALRLTRVLLPDDTEARYLSGKNNLKEAGKSLLRKGASIVAMKLGERGCFVMTKEDAFRVSGFKVKPVDTTGAGDAYNAGFVVARLKGWELRNSARFANAVAALKTMRKGATIGLPHMHEVEEFMRHEEK